MMNLSELLTSIKMDVGIYGLALPFENPDKTLYDVIKLKTLKTFSPFCPQVMKFTLSLSEMVCKQSMYYESIYEIPPIFGERNLLYIKKVTPKNKALGAGYAAPLFDSDIDTYSSLAMAQANANLISQAAPAVTFKFRPPNVLHLFYMATYFGEIDIEVCLEHAENLSTISPTSWESFYELALLDIKRFLYNTLKHYSEIQTAYGTINLKIDEWSSAESDRKDLIEKWRDIYHLDTDTIIII